MPRDVFQSARLFYRAVEPSDEPFLQAVTRHSESRLNAIAFLPVPTGSKNTTSYRQFLESCFLGAVICLLPDDPSTLHALPASTAAGKAEEGIALTPIGTIALMDHGPRTLHSRNVHTSLSLAEQYQNKGYGTEALQWALEWAFVRAGLHKVCLSVYAYNERAIRVYEKIGFVREGTLREQVWHEGKFWDSYEYGILDREWRALREAESGKS